MDTHTYIGDAAPLARVRDRKFFNKLFLSKGALFVTILDLVNTSSKKDGAVLKFYIIPHIDYIYECGCTL